jgi:CheY-like chemotaxis protein
MKEQRLILLVEDNDDDVELTLRALRRNRVADRVDVVRDGLRHWSTFSRRGATPVAT